MKINPYSFESIMQHSGRKKVVYLIRTLKLGGAERYVAETAVNLNQEIFEPKIYTVSGGGPLEKYANQRGVEVTIFNSTRSKFPIKKQIPFWRSRKFFALCRYLRREKPDIVHCFMFSPSIYGGIAAKLTGNAVILTNRMALGYHKDRKPHYQLLENFVNRFTDAVLVNSKALKHDVLRRERISPEKIHLVYGGVDIYKYRPLNGKPEVRLRLIQKKRVLGIPETAPVIGMIANLFEYKGYKEFLIAASEVRQHHPDAHFLCIGEDRGIQPQLEQLIRDLELQHQVIFTGQVRNIVELFHIIDIQVSASHQEGFSSAIIEGMALAKPVVATSVGGTPEAVLNNETGLLVPPKNPVALAEAIKTLLDNPKFATQLGRNGRKRVEENFSVETMVSKLETLYLKLSPG